MPSFAIYGTCTCMEHNPSQHHVTFKWEWAVWYCFIAHQKGSIAWHILLQLKPDLFSIRQAPFGGAVLPYDAIAQAQVDCRGSIRRLCALLFFFFNPYAVLHDRLMVVGAIHTGVQQMTLLPLPQLHWPTQLTSADCWNWRTMKGDDVRSLRKPP